MLQQSHLAFVALHRRGKGLNGSHHQRDVESEEDLRVLRLKESPGSKEIYCPPKREQRLRKEPPLSMTNTLLLWARKLKMISLRKQLFPAPVGPMTERWLFVAFEKGSKKVSCPLREIRGIPCPENPQKSAKMGQRLAACPVMDVRVQRDLFKALKMVGDPQLIGSDLKKSSKWIKVVSRSLRPFFL